MRSEHRALLVVAAVCLLGGCSSAPEPAPVLGEAFVGPATLQVRKELAARAELVATLKHGERVDLIGRRRRFYHVRTSSGAEGWVDGRQLLSPELMKQLGALAEQVAKAPSQGEATVFDLLNVHTEPNRQSPSFFQLGPGKYADLIAYVRAPRAPFQAPELIPAPAPREPRVKKKEQEDGIPPPPAGKPPGAPANWLSLSGNPTGAIAPKPPSAESASGLPMEDWALLRDKNGRAGWALARNLFMAIPDEVAQYAERARISAYFAIGEVAAKGETKKVWLWAALTPGVTDRDFDSLRIFTYNPRRQRYETAFIERNLRGWLPILVFREGATAKSFRVVVQEKTGAVVEREYSLSGFRTRVTSRRPARQPEPYWRVDRSGRGSRNPDAGQRDDESWKGTAEKLIEGIKGRLKR